MADEIKPSVVYDSRDVEKSSSPDAEKSDGAALVVSDKLARQLSARQVQMIAIAGTIGTGLFLGTGKSLATGGPASMLISYSIVGAIVFITMLSLGEMATFIPIAGSFCTYAGRFVDDAFGFALTWNYWFNDAVSTAADLVALQLLLKYWTDSFPGWAFSLVFLFVLIGLNIVSVRAYGEMEYILSLLKVVTIVVFIILGIVVNCGGNVDHQYIGGSFFLKGDAPFVGGIGGFASVGGTESIAITAGETKDPTRNMPKVIRNVFWRILIFYILAILMIGLNVPYDYPELTTKDSRTSPFTIVFQQAGSHVAGSFINAVIVTSVLSAGNHALFAGTRLLYTLAVNGHGPSIFGKLNRWKTPWIAVIGTSAISGLCFGASYIGAGQLWTWLQNIVGVSNQLSWMAIGYSSLRFRRAVRRQNLEHLLPFKNWTYPWGPFLSIGLNGVLILVQGWSSFSPEFKPVDFVSFYIQIPVILLMFLIWKFAVKKSKLVKLEEMDLLTDRYEEARVAGAADLGASSAVELTDGSNKWQNKLKRAGQWVFL
ncbi:Basic amino-acid permease [Microsporum audouinii]